MLFNNFHQLYFALEDKILDVYPYKYRKDLEDIKLTVCKLCFDVRSKEAAFAAFSETNFHD